MKIARRTTTCTAAIAVLAVLPVAAAAKLDGGTRYAGATSDGGAVQLRLSGNAKLVARMRIHYTVRCDNDRMGNTYTTILNVRIRRGTFKGSGSYTGAADGSVNNFKVGGTVWKRRASGTFSLTAKGPAGAAGGAVTCRTGVLRWHASRTR